MRFELEDIDWATEQMHGESERLIIDRDHETKGSE
jgi:hypothetical protein